MRILLASLVLALPAQAASLRGETVLSGPDVRLSDLFDGVVQDRVIGPAPEPGGRIVVEAAQLGAIARQFNVDWRPLERTDRLVLERPGHAFPRDAAVAALRAALADAGVAADAAVDMPGFVPPLVPNGEAGQAEVGQLDYQPAQGGGSGRFTAVLSVTAPGMEPAHARMSGRVTEMVEVPVAARRLMPGDVIGAADVQLARIQVTAIRAEVAQTLAEAIGMAARHPIGPGAPLLVADLVHPTMVQRGEPVRMELELPGISVAAEGTAMENGAAGERIRVLNPASRTLVETEVIGRGRVRVTGTVPVPLPPGAPVPVRLASP